MKDAEVVELFRACVAGGREERAWGRFVLYFGPRLRANVARVLRRLDRPAAQELIEDLVQDVYIRLLERGRSFRGGTEGEVVRFLQRVCESVVVDRLRGRGALKRGGRARLVELQAVGAESVADGGASPEQRCLDSELRRLLRERCLQVHLGSGSERDLLIFELAVVEGWTSLEIARRLGGELKAASVDSVVHRQRVRLRRHGFEAPPR